MNLGSAASRKMIMEATRTTTRMAVLAILALAGATAAAAPALAGDRGHKNGHRHGYWGPPGPAYYYAPPRAYYAPPPVYYAPPPVYYGPPAYAVPGLSFGINIPLR